MTAKQLTTKDLIHAFGVTPMTITNWRAGSPTKGALPFTKKGRAVHYAPAKVKRWAERNNVNIINDLEPQERAKPGPKVRTAAEA